MGYKQFRKKTKADPGDSAYAPLTVYLPKSIYEILKAKSDTKRIPISRLVCYAVDNEIAAGEDGFNYPCDEPKTVFVEDAYTDEGGRIFRFLKQLGAPQSVDQLMLLRRQIGVPDKGTFMLAIRELLNKTSLVELIAAGAGQKFKFASTYRLIAVKTSDDEKKKKEIQKLEEQLTKLKGGKIDG